MQYLLHYANKENEHAAQQLVAPYLALPEDRKEAARLQKAHPCTPCYERTHGTTFIIRNLTEQEVRDLEARVNEINQELQEKIQLTVSKQIHKFNK